MRIPFTYHEKYNEYDLGEDHPLIGDKPRRTFEFFREKGIVDEYLDVMAPVEIDEKHLLLVHTQQHVDKVKFLSRIGGRLSIDTPAPRGIYHIARLAVGGTVLAGEKLFEDYNIAINPLGGFHHACRDSSSGFCFFNDIAVVIEILRKKYGLKSIAVIDLDA
ncbi:MAG TPA: hypothetical protein ENG74_01590, partial [Thermoplasmatales archaeon]|nr:hypothetical protein [Thermoplasmatales archaeon]